ncbi:MAG: hypothetical protein ABII21_04470 [bacterium]
MIEHKNNLSLILIFAILYCAAVYRFQTQPRYVLFFTLVFAGLYFFWGIFHHLQTKSFQVRVMLEYLLVALLGVIIVSTLLI